MTLGTYRAESPQASYAAARTAAVRALELAPGSGAARAVLGMTALYLDWDWRGARIHLARAVEQDDQSARVHQLYSRYLAAAGDHENALRHARRAVALAPASVSARTDYGLAHFYAGDFGRAEAICTEAAGMLPQFLPARRCAADAAAEAGNVASAVRLASELAPDAAAGLQADVETGGLHGFWRHRARRLETGMTEEDCDRRAWPLAVALAHSGDRGTAMDWLERAAQRRTDHLVYAGVHPAFAPMRSERRFQLLLQRIGLANSSVF
jgi:tetratricopeptide (TPR) repeat protein